MSSKDIFMIVLLVVILAIVYKIMQSLKLQSELTQGIAIKAGVVIPKKKKRNLLGQETGEIEESEYTESEEAEEEETEEQGENQEEETQEEEENNQEENNEEEEIEDENNEEEVETVHAEEVSNPDNEQNTRFIKVVKPNTDTDNNVSKKKFNPKKFKLKGYELIAKLLDTPLNAGDLKEKWKQEYGDTPDKKIVYNLNYALELQIVKKHLIGKRFIYGRPEMFDGDIMKQEYLPQQYNKTK